MSKGGRLAVAVLGLAVMAGSPGAEGTQSLGIEHSGAPAAPTRGGATLRAEDESGILKRWGIRVEGLRLASAGYMLDFRYHVVDARKAKPLFQRRTKPVLTDEKTGAVMTVPTPPKTGPLRSSNDPKAGRTYFMLFANPGRFVQEGQTATVTIGEFSVSGLRVRER